MANTISLIPVLSSIPALSHAGMIAYYIADTDAGKPVTGLNVGDLCFAKDTGILYIAASSTKWNTGGAVGGGPDPPGAAGLIGKVSRRSMSTSISVTNLTDGTPAGVYVVSYALDARIASGSSTVQLFLAFTNPHGSHSYSGQLVDLSGASVSHDEGVIPIVLESGNITYQATVVGTIGAARYDLDIRCVYQG